VRLGMGLQEAKGEGYTYRGQTFDPPQTVLSTVAERWRKVGGTLNVASQSFVLKEGVTRGKYE